MKFKKLFILYFVIQLTISIKAQEKNYIIPTQLPREQAITHKGFYVSYNSAFVLSSAVSYKVLQDNSVTVDNIKSKYAADPQVETRSASKKDYKNSNYIMAQLVNYKDIAQINGAIEESFYMTNIVPMKQTFHKFIWAKSEDLIRIWAKDKGDLFVVSGVILNEGPFKTFGDGKVSIPQNFYKVVYDPVNHEAIAFKFRNGMSSGKLKGYSMSVEELEKLTNMDFFPEMEPNKKQALKSNVNYDFWNFEPVDGK